MCSRSTSTSSPSLRLLGSLNSSIATAPSDLKPTSRMTAVSVTRSTFDLTISPSWIFDSVPSYSRVIFSISSDEYSSSRPERTRSCGRGGLRVGMSSSNSSTSRASTSIQCTGSVVGLRLSSPLQSQGGRVEQHRIGGGFEGGDPPVGIGSIPGRQRLAFAAHHLAIHGLAPLRQPPAGPFIGRGRQKNLQRRLGKDDGADVATIYHHTSTTCTTSTALHRRSLLGVYPGPDLGNGRDGGDGASHALAPDRLLDVHTGDLWAEDIAHAHQAHRQLLRETDDPPTRPRFPLPPSPFSDVIERRERQGAIQRAGVEMRPAEPRRDEAGGRAFAGCRRAVDRDYAQCHRAWCVVRGAWVRRRSAKKSG